MLPKNSTNFVRKAPVALMITAVLGLAYQVRADVIEVIASTEDTNLIDGSGLNVPDGLGDSTGDTAFTSLTTGEGSDGGSVDDANFSRAWLPFALTPSERIAIASAEKIELQLFNNLQSNVAGFHVDLLGYENRENVVAVVGDYEATDVVQLVNSFLDESDAPVNFYTVDVTSFVKTEAARSANSAVIFQLRMDPQPSDNGVANQYLFVSADNTYLGGIRKPRLLVTPVPEPSTMISLGLAGLLVLRRGQRNRSK